MKPSGEHEMGAHRAASVLEGIRLVCGPDSTVAEPIRWHATTMPESLAVQHGTDVLSFIALERRSNQLAHYLRSRGACRGQRVVLLAHRSADLVVSALAIVKTGAAYVPIDPAYPAARALSIVDDASPVVVVGHGEVCSRCLPHADARVVRLDAERPAIEREPVEPPDDGPLAADAVYVVYTSGSTGQPKGVEVGHASLLNLVHWHQQAFCVSVTDRASQVASPAFDAFGWEVWPYLAAGASVHLVDEANRTSAERLRDWMLAERISIGFVPTPLAEAMMRLPWPARAPLRTLLTGADRLRSYPPPGLPFSLVNNYGPTEATVVATSATVQPAAASAPPSIGLPIANTNVYLLDEERRLVPAGDEGELYIGGAGVANGYLNRPSLTVERFLPDPFAGVDGARMYRTGDRARLQPDGQIAFLGRTDDQIKIRGHRVEPEEVVSALNGSEGVEASAVVLREDTPGDPHLVAYVVPTPGAELRRTTLLEGLRLRLPDYMIPTAVVRLDRLPLSTSGKIDRLGLPAPAPENVLGDAVHVAPRTALEAQVAGIVEDLLQVRAVSVEDNFFYLGGHSLMGTQLIARIRDGFGVELPLRAVFEAASIAGLAAEIERLVASRVEELPDDQLEALLAGEFGEPGERGGQS